MLHPEEYLNDILKHDPARKEDCKTSSTNNSSKLLLTSHINKNRRTENK